MEKTAPRAVKHGNPGRAAALLLLLAALVWLLAGCGSPSSFEGSRISNASGFWLEYAILDRTETADLALEEGEQLQVSLLHTDGTVDLTVGQTGAEPLYTGSGQTDADFVLTAPKKGTYRITVTGHRARGRVFVTRIPAEGEE